MFKPFFMESIQDIIKTEFETRKKKNAHFSLRSFARKLEISPAQLSQIMNGKRPITLKFIKKIAAKLNYSPREVKSLMDSFIKDKGGATPYHDQKRIRLEDDHFKLIADWYHFAILSLTKLKEAKSDPRWIASQLGISITDASAALIRLERLGLIRTKPRFEQIGDPLEVSSDTPSEAIRKYHKQNLVLAIEKIEDVPNELREIQSICLPLQLSDISKYKKLVDQFINVAVENCNNNDADVIYNFNIQFFPITKNHSKNKEPL